MKRLALSLLFFLISNTLIAQEWSQWGGPMRDFSLPKNTVVHPWGGDGLETQWTQDLGDGSSTIVTDGKTLYTMYRTYDGTTIGQEEIIVALDAATGNKKWDYTYAAHVPADQGWQGEKGPNGTPLLYEDMLFSLGFTSELTALDAKTGKKAWSYNLIKEFNADVIYFGNACSPIGYGDNIIVMGFGADAGTFAFNAKTGKIAWKSEKMFNSYSSPIIATMHGEDHLIGVGGKYVWGLSPKTGKTLWKHALKNPESTNAPSPMLLPENQILVAGQGIDGAAVLQVSKADDGYTLEEKWHNRKIGLFMGTHVRMDDLVLGGDRRLMFAFDWKTGEILWRKRGYKNPKLVAAGDRALILDDNGLLTLATFDRNGINKLATTKLLENRTWTAPTVSGNTLYARDRRIVKAVSLPDKAAKIDMAMKAEKPDKNLVENLYLAGKFEEASKTIDELIASSPDEVDEDWLNSVGRMLIQQDMTDAAIALFSGNKKRYPESGYASYGLREAYRNGGNDEMVAKLDKEILVPVKIVVTVPSSTEAEDKLFLAGNNSWLGSWKADGLQLERMKNGSYAVEVGLPKKIDVEYKVTRGSWPTAEQDADGQNMDNRSFIVYPEGQTVEITVAKWSDRE
ncbi:MAG: PQQ-binding-like beta-propeller repeat protein [Calditrichia bacterium]